MRGRVPSNWSKTNDPTSNADNTNQHIPSDLITLCGAAIYCDSPRIVFNFYVISTMIKAQLIQHNNDDNLVVDAARASFGRTHDQYTGEQNKRLINYLAPPNDHWTPFSHPRFTFLLAQDQIDLWELTPTEAAGMVWQRSDHGCVLVRYSFHGWVQLMKKFSLPEAEQTLRYKMPTSYAAYKLSPRVFANDHSTTHAHPDFVDETFLSEVPIFVARQEFKHMVGATRNERSGRYVSDEPSFYAPETWRSKPEKGIKQGSGGINESNETIKGFIYPNHIKASSKIYNDFIDRDVAPEMARMVLPQSMMTSYYTTGSISMWKRLIKQRLNDTNAQKEIRDYAALVNEALTDKYGSNIDV